jgi:hypothetical protein
MEMEVTAPVESGMPLDEFLEAMGSAPFELIEGERILRIPSVLGPTKTIQASGARFQRGDIHVTRNVWR